MLTQRIPLTHVEHSRLHRRLALLALPILLPLCGLFPVVAGGTLWAQQPGLYVFGDDGNGPGGQFQISQNGSELNLDFFSVNATGACADAEPLLLGGSDNFWCKPSGNLFDCGPANAALPRNEHRVLDRINLFSQPNDSINVFFDTLCQEEDGPVLTDNGQATAHRVACTPDDTTLCLNNGRFGVTVDWENPFSNGTQQALTGPRSGDGDSGFFFFSDPNNIEFVVKVLDACGFTNTFWVFSAASTDVEYTLEVLDTETNQSKSYFNPLGQASPAITDTSAFATCP